MVLSPKSLWQSYNRTLLPLDPSDIRSFETENGTEKFVYFNGEATAMGCTRIYARLTEPKEKTDKIVLVFLSPEYDISAADFSPLIGEGYSVLVVDYAGLAFDRSRYTMYPPALSFANYNPDTLYDSAETPQKTCWYVWTTVALRSITYAESIGYKKAAMLGVGIGGSHVFKAAALSSFPSCAISLFSPTFFPPGEDSSMLKVSSCLDIYGYAPLLKTPFLQLCCSNDSDSSLDDISDLHEQTGGRSLLYIAPRSDKVCTETIENNIKAFFATYLDDKPYFNKNIVHACSKTTLEIMSLGDSAPVTEENEDTNSLPPIILSANGAEKKLYYSLKCNEKIKEAAIYVSHGITNSSYRNWRRLPIEKVGEDEYLGYTEVYSFDKPIFAFACVITEEGFSFSSPVLKKIPSQLKIMPTTIAKRRLIYDSDMGIDDFFSVGTAPHPVMKTGPFNINGISCSSVLCTYKIGDATYSGAVDGTLQLQIFSPVAQKVKFSVTDGEQFSVYSCVQNVSPANDWSKIMLPASSFKSAEGTFVGWDKAIFLQIEPEEEIIISSLLWV